MLHEAELVGDNGSFPCNGLIDSPADELALIEQRQALLADAGEFFDPLGLYPGEVERDEATSALAEAFPTHHISLTCARTTQRLAGEWSDETHWTATLHDATPAGDVSGTGTTPTEAVEAVKAAFARATAPIRSKPEHRGLDSDTGEAFGTIDPATAADFLELVQQFHGRNDFLIILLDGRVLLFGGSVGASEAAAIGDMIALHNLSQADHDAEAAIKIIIDRQKAGLFKTHIVLPSGERIDVPGVYTNEHFAWCAAQASIRARRSTIFTPAIAQASTAA